MLFMLIYKIIESGIEYTIEEYSDLSKDWYYNDKFHREQGPARTWNSGEKEYWLNGIHYPDVSSPEELLIASIIK